MGNERLFSIKYALIKKCLHIPQIIIIWAASKFNWLERQVSDRKVADSMPALGINANYLTGT